MTTTSTRIVLDLGSGTLIKDGLSASIADVFDGCDLTDFSTGLGEEKKWATFEPNEWLLDGSYHLLNDAVNHIGAMSDTVSDAVGAFGTPPELRIDFDTDYDLVSGITMFFNNETGDYCDDVDIDFYDSGDGLIDNDSYAPDDTEYFFALPANPLENVRYIIVTFNSTAAAYRHLRITDIVFDTIVFNNSKIQNATLIEEINQPSVELPSNSIEFEVFSDTPDFDIITPSTQYENLKYKARTEVYETIDGVETYLGRFYLQDWESITPYRARFIAADAIWLLGETSYKGNCWWYPSPNLGGDLRIYSQDLLDDLIVDLAGLTYSLDASLEDIYMEGVLDCENIREALQQICFAIGAYADCSRSNTINIKPLVLPEDSTGTDFEYGTTNGQGFKQGLRPLVTGIELSAIVLTTSSSPPYKVLLDENLATGTYIYYYDYDGILTDWILTPGADPDVTITDASKGQFTIVITNGPKSVTLETNEIYDINYQKYSQYNGSLPAGTPVNVLVINNAAFAKNNKNTTSNGQAIVDLLYDYYANRTTYDIKTFGEIDVVPGAEVLVSPPIGSEVNGIIEKVTTNLIGFISQANILVAYVP